MDKLKIGFLIPSMFFFSGKGNGVVAQAVAQGNGLQELGCDVDFIDPWKLENCRPGVFDILHFFQGGHGLHGIERVSRKIAKKVVFAPIIDSNQTNLAYRLFTEFSKLLPQKISSMPEQFYVQAMTSDLVIVRSTHEYERITKGLGVPGEKVRIVLNGVTPATSWASERELRAKFDLPGKFVLHVSAWTQPRKNIRRLIEAMEGLGLNLVIAGRVGYDAKSNELFEFAKSKSFVTILGFLEEPELWGLYRLCNVFALPSVNEGTGLVGLEAASMGANVIITNRGGTEDYFKDIATMVNPFSVDEIRSAIEKEFHSSRNDVRELPSWTHSSAALYENYTRIRHSA